MAKTKTKSMASCVFLLLVFALAKANDYSNGNFEAAAIPSKEVMNCMGKLLFF